MMMVHLRKRKKNLGFLHKQVCKEFMDGQTEFKTFLNLLEQLPQFFQDERVILIITSVTVEPCM